MKTFRTRNDMLKEFNRGLIIAELGVFKGEFSKIIYETCEPSKLYLVDLFEGEHTSGDKDGKNLQTVNLEMELDKIRDDFKDMNVQIVKANTVDFLLSIEDDYFDLVYIDADHSYNGVMNDLKLSQQKVKNNGYICGHDYIPYTACAAAVNHFCQSNNLKIEYITEDGCPSFCIINKK